MGNNHDCRERERERRFHNMPILRMHYPAPVLARLVFCGTAAPHGSGKHLPTAAHAHVVGSDKTQLPRTEDDPRQPQV